MSNFRTTISYIWPIIMKYKWMFYSIFFLSAGRVLLASIVGPLFYKRIIDVISKGGVDRAAVSQPLLQSIFFIALILPIGWLFGRITQHVVSKFQSYVIRDLHELSFERLHGHSYAFFADNFAGALVNKSRKFVRAFEITSMIRL